MLLQLLLDITTTPVNSTDFTSFYFSCSFFLPGDINMETESSVTFAWYYFVIVLLHTGLSLSELAVAWCG